MGTHMKFNILDLLLPRETKFYSLLSKQAETLLDASKEFRLLMGNLNGGNNDATLKNLVKIKEFEKSGDKLEKNTIDELDKTFITPMDREDILRISAGMGIPLDLLHSLSRKLEIYGIHETPSAVMSYCDILVSISDELVNLMAALPTRKDVPQIVRVMHELEKRGDDIFHQAVAKLFESSSPVEIIKFKEVYEVLEQIIDSVDNVGKLVRAIMIKLG
jgi:uncharacterized protein Yka (UPF0111/DUF47 family)